MATIMHLGGGGGGVNLNVVSGTTRPEAPKNNTIWVNTETSIGRAYFAPTAPESPATGDLWVNTTNRYQTDSSAIASQTHLLTVAESPYLTINVLQFKQWDGEAWVWKDGGIYANNEWVDMALYLYWYGTQNESYPIRYGRDTELNGYQKLDLEPVFADDHFEVSSNGSLDCVAITMPNDYKIDVTGFSNMGIAYKKYRGTLVSSRFFCGFTDRDNSTMSYNDSCNVQSMQLAGSANLTEITMPLTCSGVLRPAIRFQGSSSDYATFYFYYWVLT